ncbi:MAG: 4-alpha-glucanotransferase [Lachnospiraceae bacterium]|nr:4-alpha-glucanotransferase [Lachnospiraceae bacterium]
MKRSSGILMAISSLPSKYGIGTFGREAYNFIDFLSESRQSWWQILPLGPTGYGDSPYQSFSSFAGSPYYIDLDMLIEDGLLSEDEVITLDWGDDPSKVDYGKLYENRLPLLAKAAERGMAKDREQFDKFISENKGVADYALYTAIKKHFGMKAWLEWPDEDVRYRKAEALEKYSEQLAHEIEVQEYIQYLFFNQWEALKEYAHEKGIGIIGDIPIYVPLDSADVWSAPSSFLLDEKNVPVEVAGVPPDNFTEDGQLWGNPLYDYDQMKADGYSWWINRIAGAAKLYDVIRIDHFRGFESFWAVPYGSDTAKDGRWVKGPGIELVKTLTNWFHDTRFIAEDLGYPSEEVVQMLKDSGLPGMKVLEFAFDDPEYDAFCPHKYVNNCICYTGTHDNETLMGWKAGADPEIVEKCVKYFGLNDEEGFTYGIIRGGMSSVADLFIAQLQDYLELGSEARMNTPGTAQGNWQWRMEPGKTDQELAEKIAAMTVLYGRS